MSNEPRPRKAGRPTLTASDRIAAALQRYRVLPGSALLSMTQLAANTLYEALDALVEEGTIMRSDSPGRASVYYSPEIADTPISELFPATVEQVTEEAA